MRRSKNVRTPPPRDLRYSGSYQGASGSDSWLGTLKTAWAWTQWGLQMCFHWGYVPCIIALGIRSVMKDSIEVKEMLEQGGGPFMEEPDDMGI